MVEIILSHEKVLKVVAKGVFLGEEAHCFWISAPSGHV